MPSDFLVDLIDHKRRVGLYMQKFTHALFQQWIDQEGQFDPPRMSLVDLARTFCQHDSIVVGTDYQVSRMLDTTAKWLEEKDISTYRGRLQCIVCDLFERAVVHDNSKFSPEEFEPYEEAFPELQKYAYGSDEFKAALSKIKPAIQHHYENNSHHPEYHQNGIKDMNLLDAIEMTCDWIAASERSQKDIFTGLEMNKDRFGISDQLYVIIKNTVIELTGKNDQP